MRKWSLLWASCVGLIPIFIWGMGEGFAATLTVTKDGTGGGTVTSSPAGISCGSDCSESYAEGKKVTLKAKADPSSLFLGWSGDCLGTGNCSLVIGSNPKVTATFQKKVPHLSVSSDSVDFGSAKPGAKVSLTLTVSNTGTGDLHVTFSGLGGSDFGITGSSSPTIKPAKSLVVKLFFKPQTEGDHTATLKLSSDDPGTPLKEIPLKGQSTSLTETDYSKLAKSLANTLSNAHTQQARYNALLSIMSPLHVGIYTGDAKPLVVGYERGPEDFYLYDFELTAMASGFGKNATSTLETIADPVNAILESMNVDDGIDLEPLRQALLADVQWATDNPKNVSSLAPLLNLELGLLSDPPYDMRNDVALENVKLNGLQRFLVFSSILAPLIEESPPTGMSLQNSRDLVESNGVVLDDSLCEKLKGVKGQWPLVVTGGAAGLGWLADKMKDKLKGAGGVAAAAALVLQMIHGQILAYSVNVSTPNEGLQETHYGPPDHFKNAGKELNFKVKVEMIDDYGETLVKCGYLVGADIPPKGPIAGVSINWGEDLERFGDVSFNPADKTTGADGISTLIFKPKEEKSPGKGKVTVERGVVEALALYQSAFNNLPGSIAQYLAPKMVFMPYEAGYHKGLSGTLHIIYDDTGGTEKYHANGDIIFSIDENGRINCEGNGYCSGKLEATMTENGSCTGTYTGTWVLEFTGDFKNESLSFDFSPFIMNWAGTRCCPNVDPPCRPFSLSVLNIIPGFAMPAKTGETYKIPFQGGGGWTFELIDVSLD